MIKKLNIICCWMTVILSLAAGAHAQDSAKRRTIDITSVFKPVLRDASKINFHATPPVADTSRPKLKYDIPSQYLSLTYQPGELKPVALQADSVLIWQNANYIKAGAGNVHLPYIKNSSTDVSIAGDVKTTNNLEWSGALGFKTDNYYLYGYKPDSLTFSDDSLRQQFTTYHGRLGLRNINPTEFGLVYKPNVDVYVFSDNHHPQATETNSVLNLPLEKGIDKNFTFDLGLLANLTNYKKGGLTIQNNLFDVAPSLFVKASTFNLHAGLTPSWDNGTFHLLPNFIADVTTSDQRLTLQLGWIGYYDKGSYQRYAGINPWPAQPDSLLNTRLQEIYGGIKGSLNDHFTYAAKVAFNRFWNMPLFVNDSITGRTFLIRYATAMNDLQLHGEIGYTHGEDFSANLVLNIHKYSGLQGQADPWGLLPLELTTTVKWQVLKDLWIKGDLWTFDGADYLVGNKFTGKGNPGLDVNAGIEFRITRQVNLWLQMNNLFNSKYERWNQYPVYGFNILGGIIFAF